jgi:hypothetical protein
MVKHLKIEKNEIMFVTHVTTHPSLTVGEQKTTIKPNKTNIQNHQLHINTKNSTGTVTKDSVPCEER